MDYNLDENMVVVFIDIEGMANLNELICERDPLNKFGFNLVGETVAAFQEKYDLCGEGEE